MQNPELNTAFLGFFFPIGIAYAVYREWLDFRWAIAGCAAILGAVVCLWPDTMKGLLGAGIYAGVLSVIFLECQLRVRFRLSRSAGSLLRAAGLSSFVFIGLLLAWAISFWSWTTWRGILFVVSMYAFTILLFYPQPQILRNKRANRA